MIRCREAESGSLATSRAFELLHSLAQLVDLGRYRRQGLGERVVDLLGIGNHHSFAVAEDDVARNTDHGGILRHISQHDRTRADAAVPPHGDIAENFRSAADHHVVFDGGVALAVLLAGTAESDALIQGHVVADDRRSRR